ncbi:hypothetical protein BTW10_13265 [Chromohalobacter japonicus]|uniref:Uncharacterized protein n=1 Tax=Chromohalobacter japonicus TaxID=223900 RepID=A0A1Q8TAM4_9GAMM|nr:hypothetical protein BTW10_13265 [Chromohalobacter japonicus]
MAVTAIIELRWRAQPQQGPNHAIIPFHMAMRQAWSMQSRAPHQRKKNTLPYMPQNKCIRLGEWHPPWRFAIMSPFVTE